MAFDVYELVIIGLITAFSAFPAVFFSLWVIFSRKRIQKMLLDQILALPELINTRPEAKTAINEAAQFVVSGVKTGVSEQIAKNAAQILGPAMTEALVPVFKSQSDSLKGQFGQMVKKVKQGISSGTGGGALDDIGSLIQTVKSVKNLLGPAQKEPGDEERNFLQQFVGFQ